MVWWIIPALTGVVGLMLGFAGIGRLLKARPFGGGLRLLGSAGFLGVSGITALTGLNLQTYHRLTHETVAAVVTFDEIEGSPQTYNATVEIPGESAVRTYSGLVGDEFEIGAKVIKYKPLSNIMGYDSLYRLQHLEGRFVDRYTTEVSTAESTGVRLFENPGIDISVQGKRFGVEDSRYGSGVYNPMGDGLKYEISMTQDALIARPLNEATERAIKLGDYPGNVGRTRK